jgi:PAS domain S-box-containing protein
MPGPGRMRQSARAVFGGLGRRVDRADSATSILAERDNYSQMLAAATGDVIFTTSPAGMITFFNEGAERLLGYRAADVVGRMRGLELHVWDEIVAVAEELGVEPGQAVFTTLAQGAADTREWTFVRSDRSHVRVSHTVTTQRDRNGAVVGYVGLAHDITARHQAELALRKSEQRFRALSEHAPVGIVQTDEQGNCWYANRRFCELVGRTEDEVRGTGWIEALDRHDHSGVLDGWTHVLATGRAFDSEFLVDRPDGTAVHVRATAGPIRADEERVTGFVVTTQDISERVGAQRRLSESEQLFRDTLENVALAAAQLDATGHVVYCNPHLAGMLGRPASSPRSGPGRGRRSSGP